MTDRGVPGTAGAVLTDGRGTTYFLSCHHVLFGHGAAPGARVWAVVDTAGGSGYLELGQVSHGLCGRVTHGRTTHFVDCAVGELDSELDPEIRRALATTPTAVGVAGVGLRVHKDGWITGPTKGVVVDDSHFELLSLDGREQCAPGQLLVRPELADHWFCAPGESGAALLDDDDRIVGVLWGVNAAGDGIACPARTALHHLGLELDARRTEWR